MGFWERLKGWGWAKTFRRLRGLYKGDMAAHEMGTHMGHYNTLEFEEKNRRNMAMFACLRQSHKIGAKTPACLHCKTQKCMFAIIRSNITCNLQLARHSKDTNPSDVIEIRFYAKAKICTSYSPQHRLS